MPLWNLSRPRQVLAKNKVSTSLKSQGIYYVADTPNFSPKVLTKPTLSIVLRTKEIKQTPLKISSELKWEIINLLNLLVMSTIKNHVQLIGNVGQEPTVTNLESGKKVARFSLATNEYYKDGKGEKQTDTNWHTIVAWGKTAEIVEKYVEKGKEVGIMGKLKTRTYTTDDGNQRYVTEVVADEVLLLGSKGDK